MNNNISLSILSYEKVVKNNHFVRNKLFSFFYDNNILYILVAEEGICWHMSQ